MHAPRKGVTQGKPKPFTRLVRRCRDRPDSELEQALIRISFPLLFLLYLAFVPPQTQTDRTLWDLGFGLAAKCRGNGGRRVHLQG